jgi:hypothetical protein
MGFPIGAPYGSLSGYKNPSKQGLFIDRWPSVLQIVLQKLAADHFPIGRPRFPRASAAVHKPARRAGQGLVVLPLGRLIGDGCHHLRQRGRCMGRSYLASDHGKGVWSRQGLHQHAARLGVCPVVLGSCTPARATSGDGRKQTAEAKLLLDHGHGLAGQAGTGDRRRSDPSDMLWAWSCPSLICQRIIGIIWYRRCGGGSGGVC